MTLVSLPNGYAIHGLPSARADCTRHAWFDAAGRMVAAADLDSNGIEYRIAPDSPLWADTLNRSATVVA